MSLVSYVVIEDSFFIKSDSESSGDIHICLSLSSESLFSSVYNFPFFNSFCEFNGEIYAANEELGVCLLGGDNDNGDNFKSGILWHQTNLGTSRPKRIQKSLWGANADNSRLQVTTESKSKQFTVSREKVMVTRDLYGRNWEFAISDFEELDYLELILLFLAR